MAYRYAKLDPATDGIVEEWGQEAPLDNYVGKARAEETGKCYILPVRIETRPKFDPATQVLDSTVTIGETEVVRGFAVRDLSADEITARAEAETKMNLRANLIDILLEKGVVSPSDAGD